MDNCKKGIHEYDILEFIEGIYEMWECNICGHILERGKPIKLGGAE